MHPVLLNILLPGAAPFAVSLAVTAALFFAFRKSMGAKQLSGAIGIAAGFACGFALLRGWPGFPPSDSANWLLFASPLGLLAVVRQNRMYRAAIAMTAAAAVVAMILRPALISEGNEAKEFGTIAASAAISGLLVISLRPISERAGVMSPAAALLAALVALAFAIVLSRSASYGQICGAIASAFAGVAIAAWVCRDSRTLLLEPAWLVTVTLGAGIAAASIFFARLPIWPALIIAASPLLAWIGAPIAGKTRPIPLSRQAAATCAAAALVAIACGGALWWIAKLIPPLEAYEY